MPKNIVVCCDGTGNEFGESKSNVVKLYMMLVHDDSQVSYYHPGVGTMGARNALTGVSKWWTKVIGLAFGYGISDNIADAYQFLMKTFQPDDTVYVFGFSRGAYTARALCGMLNIIGLLREDNEGLIPYSIRMIKSKKIDFAVAADFKKTFCRECKPHFVGVWDTVSSVWAGFMTSHTSRARKRHTTLTCIMCGTRYQLTSAGHSFVKTCSELHTVRSRTSRKFGLPESIQILAGVIPSQRASFPKSPYSGWSVKQKP